jgi:hypothetical protein
MQKLVSSTVHLEKSSSVLTFVSNLTVEGVVVDYSVRLLSVPAIYKAN